VVEYHRAVCFKAVASLNLLHRRRSMEFKHAVWLGMHKGVYTAARRVEKQATQAAVPVTKLGRRENTLRSNDHA